MPQRVLSSFGPRIAAWRWIAAVIVGYSAAALCVSLLTSLPAAASRAFSERFLDLWWAAMVWAALTAGIAFLVSTRPASRVGWCRAALLYGSVLLGASWVVNAVFLIPHAITGVVELVALPRLVHTQSLVHLPFNAAAAAALVSTFHWLLTARQTSGAAIGVQPPAGNSDATDGLVVTAGRRAYTLPIESIEWIEAADDYVFLHRRGGSLICNERLYKLEDRLAGSGFVRAHRSALVNLEHVAAITGPASGELLLELSGGSRVRVSRRRQRQVRRAVLAQGGLASVQSVRFDNRPALEATCIDP